jgi:hypothetical protein
VSKYLDSEELIRGTNADTTQLGGDLRASLGKPNRCPDIKVLAVQNILGSNEISITAAEPHP